MGQSLIRLSLRPIIFIGTSFSYFTRRRKSSLDLYPRNTMLNFIFNLSPPRTAIAPPIRRSKGILYIYKRRRIVVIVFVPSEWKAGNEMKNEIIVFRARISLFLVFTLYSDFRRQMFGVVFVSRYIHIINTNTHTYLHENAFTRRTKARCRGFCVVLNYRGIFSLSSARAMYFAIMYSTNEFVFDFFFLKPNSILNADCRNSVTHTTVPNHWTFENKCVVNLLLLSPLHHIRLKLSSP